MADERNINLALVKGTGDFGRIIKRDIDNYSGGSSVPTVESYTEVEVSQMRKVIAQRLGESKFSAPHFYLTCEINMDKTVEARQAINTVSPIKISYNDVVPLLVTPRHIKFGSLILSKILNLYLKVLKVLTHPIYKIVLTFDYHQLKYLLLFPYLI